MNAWVWVGASVAAYQVGVTTHQFSERHRWWDWARAYSDRVSKPMLQIGLRKSGLEPANPDVTLDIDPRVLQQPGGILGDERSMPAFASGQFGACFNSHTLEHLQSPADVQLAVNECCRVAECAVFLVPGSENLLTSLWPDHKLWVIPVECGFSVRYLHDPPEAAVFVCVPGRIVNADPIVATALPEGV